MEAEAINIEGILDLLSSESDSDFELGNSFLEALKITLTNSQVESIKKKGYMRARRIPNSYKLTRSFSIDEFNAALEYYFKCKQ